MAETILYGTAVQLLRKLGSPAFDEIATIWGFKARLQKLKSTINTIKDVLLDAEEKQAHNHAVHGWLQRLATAVYAADDLFDEFATLASRKQLIGGSNFTKKLRTFLSRSNQIIFAINISQKVKTIRQQLDDIAKDSTQFAFIIRPHEDDRAPRTLRGRDQTYSFVDTEEVIGRDDDKKAILGMLLASSSDDHDHDHEHQHDVLPVISIVGIGGLGKTALARLVYNDSQVEKYFELKLWVCVSDVFDIQVITKKILTSITLKLGNQNLQKKQIHGELWNEINVNNNLEMEDLQSQLRNKVNDKKYLLVMDDVWNEEREEWLKLRALLKMGKVGSKILVTTRSRKVAKIMGTVPPYELRGLSEANSWELFQKMAFEPGQAQQQPHLAEVGREIVKESANVPLAIRTLANLLYKEDENKWLSVKSRGLAKNHEDKKGVTEILMLSYDHLQSPLKKCFTYCALFPKDYEYDKEILMDLWIAEGFIVSVDRSQNLEELAEEYFLTLLQRCFFQDIKRDEWGAIMSCKMHDLMHDLAQQVVGVKCMVVKLREEELNGRIYHLSFDFHLDDQWMIQRFAPNLKVMRTFLLPAQQIKYGSSFSKSICEELISSSGCLRVLDLHNLGLKSLPSSIGGLIHLRYLNLSKNFIKVLPETITKLHNLQTLNLHGCLHLTKLPEDIRRLVNLRNLDFGECFELDYMPSRIGELTSLQKLPLFIVNYYKHQNSARLSDLGNLQKLRGALHIKVPRELNDAKTEARAVNLDAKHGLTKLFIELLDQKVYWESSEQDVNGSKHDEYLLEGLRPHTNLRKLGIQRYRGQKLPSWATNLRDNLPQLVSIKLEFAKCQEVPTFSQLPSLKRLILVNLENVEYMEGGVDDLAFSSSLLLSKVAFFPSLQELILMGMTRLKGWWKGGSIVDNGSTGKASNQMYPVSFSNLAKLTIEMCPNLTILPLCPNVEELILWKQQEPFDVTNDSNFISQVGIWFEVERADNR